jgi:hypothetical protein
VVSGQWPVASDQIRANDARLHWHFKNEPNGPKGLIEKKGIVSFRQTPLQGNMHDFAAITERGRKYLQLRNEMLQEGVSPAG